MTRPTFDEYFLAIAQAVSARATCPRKSVGAVLTYDNRVVSTGYNGSRSGEPQCDEDGCLIVDSSCKRVTHAEANAIRHARARCSLRSPEWFYATVYVTTSPCIDCFRIIAGSNIKRVVFPEWFYRDRFEIEREAALNGIELVGPK